MNTIMSKTPYDSSFSSSKRNFQLQVQLQDLHPSTTPTIITVSASPAYLEPTKTLNPVPQCQVKETPMTTTTTMTAAKTTISASSSTTTTTKATNTSTAGITTNTARTTTTKVCEVPTDQGQAQAQAKKKPAAATAVLRLRSALSAFAKARWHAGLGSRVTVTLFGHRRGHVHFAFQEDPKSSPALVIELATSTSGLVREMASGLVRIALECDKRADRAGSQKLLDEPLWRTYCNGRKCGFATRRECRPADTLVLKAVEPISMGAGVLPGPTPALGPASEGELMYMRAKFDRVVGSRDSEAFYMMNPEPGPGGPELSIYLLRV